MSATPQRRLPPAAGKTPIETHALQEFGRKLHALLIAKGLSQSDLAREVWGATKDTRGYNVARNRDRISAYVSGKSIPEPQNLARIAQVLGVSPEELAPDIMAASVDRERPEMAMTMVAGHPDKVHLVVDKLVSLSVASRVVAIIAGEDEPKR